MAAADFKAKCLAVLDDVEAGVGAVVITKRGRPVAQLVALPGARAQDLRGSVLAGLDEALEPVAAAWKAPG